MAGRAYVADPRRQGRALPSTAGPQLSVFQVVAKQRKCRPPAWHGMEQHASLAPQHGCTSPVRVAACPHHPPGMA